MVSQRETELLLSPQTKPLARATRLLHIDPTHGPYTPRISRVGSVLQGDRADFVIVDELASHGGEAMLYLCHMVDNPSTRYVAKIYMVQARSVNQKRRQRLVEFLSRVNPDSSFVMPLVDHGLIEDVFFDILPYYPEGDLSTKGSFTFDQLRSIIVPAANAALREIHLSGFIHRDIKPGNLYLHQGRAILGDFGISSMIDPETDVAYTRNISGTLGYVAPEVGQGIAHPKSDYFALGMTLASLYKGSDIWQGLSEQVIYRCLVKKELPLDIPEKDKRLRDLIRGLTTMDVERRFGSEELGKWCRGEPVAVRDTGYIFDENDPIEDTEVLAERFLQQWEKGVKHLYHESAPLQSYFQPINQELALCISDIVKKDCANNRDLGLFRFLYSLNSKLFLCWQGIHYNSLTSIALRMQQALPNPLPEIMAMLKSKAVSWRFEQPKQRSPEEQQLLDAVRKVEAWIDAEAVGLAYYLFMYLFLPAGATRAYELEGRAHTSIDAVFAHVTSDAKLLHSAAGNLWRDDRFIAFACALGFEGTATRLRSDQDASMHGRIRSLFVFFEETVRDTAAVHLAYLKYCRGAPAYWLQQNLHLYAFSGYEAVRVRRDISSVKVDGAASIVQLDKALVQLEDIKNEFLRLLQNNILMASIGIYDGRDRAGITAVSSDAYFLYDFYGTESPLGYARSIGLSGSGRVE